MKKLHMAVGLASVFASAIIHAGTALDPLEMRWTFGAHEPYTMYRRVGRHCTGGSIGNFAFYALVEISRQN